MTQEKERAELLDEEGRQRTLTEAINLFVRPEIERRRLAGTLQLPFELLGFQVAWTGGGDAPPEVRLNAEIRVVARMEGKIAPGTRIGDLFQPGESTKISAIHMVEEEAGRFAHFSSFRVGHHWYYTFDFRYRQEAARKHLVAAEEFWSVAESALKDEKLRAFVDNAHSAAELVTKIDLLLLNQVGEGRLSHQTVRGTAAKFFHLQPLHTLVQRLTDLRMDARYLLSEFNPDSQEITEIHEALAQWMERARARARRIAPPNFGGGAG